METPRMLTWDVPLQHRFSQQALLHHHWDVIQLCCSHAMLKTVLSYYSVVLGFCPVTKAPFTAAPCLLSSFSLEFGCSG